MLQAHDLTLSYGGRNIVEGLSLDLPERGLSIIIGPNGCGKSTVLKALGRLLKPQLGKITLGGRDISGMGTKHVAKHIGVLPQSPHAPDGGERHGAGQPRAVSAPTSAVAMVKRR